MSANVRQLEGDNQISQQKKYLSLDEVSELTGFTKGSLYKMTSTRKIPHYKPFGKTLFFKITEIQEMFDSSRVSTMDEIESDAITYCLTSKNNKNG